MRARRRSSRTGGGWPTGKARPRWVRHRARRATRTTAVQTRRPVSPARECVGVHAAIDVPDEIRAAQIADTMIGGQAVDIAPDDQGGDRVPNQTGIPPLQIHLGHVIAHTHPDVLATTPRHTLRRHDQVPTVVHPSMLTPTTDTPPKSSGTLAQECNGSWSPTRQVGASRQPPTPASSPPPLPSAAHQPTCVRADRALTAPQRPRHPLPGLPVYCRPSPSADDPHKHHPRNHTPFAFRSRNHHIASQTN